MVTMHSGESAVTASSELVNAAVKQLDTEMSLQSTNLVTDRGRRHVQLAGGAREAQQTRRGLERAQRSQGREWLVCHEIISSLR